MRMLYTSCPGVKKLDRNGNVQGESMHPDIIVHLLLEGQHLNLIIQMTNTSK